MKKLLIVLCLAFSALPAHAKTPDWINGVSSKYPQNEFLIGVGVGDTLDNARSSARAEIAKIFRARIVQTAQDTKSERLSQEGSSSRYSSKQDSALSTSVSTDELLQGVEIAETWQNEKNKTFYALAVLDKRKTSRALMQQIIDQEETIAGKMKQAGSGSVLERLRALNGALDAVNRKDELNARRQVLDPHAAGDVAMGSVRADIEKQRAGLIGRVRFVVQADETPNLASRVTEKITGMGFSTVPSLAEVKSPDLVVLIVSAKAAVSPLDRNNPQWKFYTWHTTISISDAADSTRVMTTVVRDGQSSHLTDDAARAKAVTEAVDAAASAVDEEMKKQFIGQ